MTKEEFETAFAKKLHITVDELHSRGLVEVDLRLKPDPKKVEIIRELFGEFISGLEAGINGE